MTSAHRWCSLVGETEPEVRVELVRERPEARARTVAGEASDHLADEEAVGVGVVGVPRPGHPPGIGGGEGRSHAVPVPEVLVGQRLVDRRHGALVAERLTKRDLVLAPGAELRPDGGEPVVETDAPGVDLLQGQQRHDRLAHAVEVHDRVGRPRLGLRLVPPATVEVDDRAPVDDHVHRRADLAPLGEALDERVADGAERRIARPPDRQLGHRAGT